MNLSSVHMIITIKTPSRSSSRALAMRCCCMVTLLSMLFGCRRHSAVCSVSRLIHLGEGIKPVPGEPIGANGRQCPAFAIHRKRGLLLMVIVDYDLVSCKAVRDTTIGSGQLREWPGPGLTIMFECQHPGLAGIACVPFRYREVQALGFFIAHIGCPAIVSMKASILA